MQTQFDFTVVDRIIDDHGAKQSATIAILQDIQEHYHYLPREIFTHLAKRLGMPSASIYSVATFYENFSLEPKGKYVIKCCDGTACHVRGSMPILNRLREACGGEKDYRGPSFHAGYRALPWRVRTCPRYYDKRKRLSHNDARRGSQADKRPEGEGERECLNHARNL